MPIHSAAPGRIKRFRDRQLDRGHSLFVAASAETGVISGFEALLRWKTTRLVETHSPVDSILAERGARHVNVNLLRYFSEPARLDSEAQAFLQRGMALAMEWATHGLVVPHVSQTIDSTVEAINAGLQSLKAGRGLLGKVVVIVDHNLAAGT